MNCYNSSPTIEESLLSLISQNYNNYKIICFENRSKDETINKIRNLNSDSFSNFWTHIPIPNIFPFRAINTLKYSLKLRLHLETFIYLFPICN